MAGGFKLTDIPNVLSRVNEDVDRCLAGVDSVFRDYAVLRSETEATFDESVAIAESVSSGMMDRRSAELDAAVAKCMGFVTYINNLHEDAMAKSKAYSKSYTEHLANSIAAPMTNEMTTLDQCQGKLLALSDLAKKAHQQITSTSGFASVVNAVSGESKKQHGELIEALDSSAAIGEQAKKLAALGKQHGEEAASAEKDTAIDAAREETDALLLQIDERESEDIARVINGFSRSLNDLMPPETVRDIDELERLTIPDPHNPPAGTSELLSIGSYACAIEAWPFIGGAAALDDVISASFGSWYSNGCLVAPALLDRAQQGSVFFCGSTEQSQAAMVSVAAAELAASAAPFQKFVLINPSGERSTFEPFLAAAKELPEVFGDGVLTDRRMIADALDRVVATINDRLQRLLIGYRDVFEFNENPETTTLPLITVCAAFNVRDITDQISESIVSIVRNGSACGISLLMAFDVEDAIEEATELLAACPKALIEWGDGDSGTVVDDCVKVVRSQISARDVAAILPSLVEQVKRQKTQSVGMESVLPRTAWFVGDSTNGLSIPMGKNPEGRAVSLEFGPQVGNGISHFGLLIGSTGSGKSSFLHSIILSSLLKYGPDELQLYLLDFKSGIEFDIYSKFRIPNIKLLALDALQAFGHSVFLDLRAKMDERNELFSGAGVQNLEDYRAATGKPMPRILVIMDEFQILFNEDHDRATARECATLFADFISLARSYGIHFLLSTQTLARLRSGSFSVAQSTLDEIHVRIGLQCSDSECSRMFGEVFAKTALEKMGTTKGSGVFTENDLNTAPESFRSVFCNKEERAALLSEIESRYSAIELPAATQVFRSSTVPNILDCAGANTSDPNELFTAVRVYLGEPVRIAEPVTLNVSRMKRSTLLVAGSDHKMLDQIISAYLVSATKSVSGVTDPQERTALAMRPCVYLCDGLSLVGEAGDDAIYRVLRNRSNAFKVARSNVAVLEFIDELYDLMTQRRNDASLGRAARYHTIHLVFNEFQWIDAFKAVFDRRDGMYFSQSAATHSNDCGPLLDDIINSVAPRSDSKLKRLEKLEELLISGYSLGINVVVTSSDFAATKERIYDLIPKLQTKIVFALSGEDSDRIVHGTLTQIETLRSNMALYSDGVNAPCVFKPYRISMI